MEGTYNVNVYIASGSGFENLNFQGCTYNSNGSIQFMAEAGQTYYLQADGLGAVQIGLEPLPPPTADFYYSPEDPSKYDLIQFYDNSNDPGNVGIATWEWDFGDGNTSNETFATHNYTSDGDYAITLTVTTFDGRTGSITRTIEVRTHDVAIAKLAAPKSANVGQTRAITVSLRNTFYPETVVVELYRSIPGGGFELIAESIQFVPVQSGNRTMQFTFNYTFTPQDGQIGKVTFRAAVIILDARDALPADNVAFSTPPTIVRR